jgi:Spy/CpxP family protein refolding chaperone
MKTMMKSRLWIVVSLVLVFAAGAAAGIFAERNWFPHRPSMRPSGRGPAQGSAPTHDRWSKELGLTEDQKARMQEIFKKNDGRMNVLQADFFKQLGEIRAEMRKEMDAVLTPEQKAKQDAMIQKYREARKKEAERRPPSPEGAHQ